ncbi:GGDEF domain-containing protein [Fundidesulfovibrio soli]|uniref:GGDEF domain-containing protein n=1 Tax=Fundidesulfovibrio soli TaxID=2922716 RepID=UPI001FAEBA38|nr:GGDEF domain-containing protein [Fundidesulfovibrio soli]
MQSKSFNGSKTRKPCFEGTCEAMDRLGIPRDSKWRALILFMRSIRDYDIYSDDQKRKMQELVVDVLKKGDLTEERFMTASQRCEEILAAKWREKLERSLADMASAIAHSKEMILKRKGDLQLLEVSTLTQVSSGNNLDEMLESIRGGFQDVIRYMEQDAKDLERLSRTDALTGLANRRAFEEELSQAVERARKGGATLCVLMADVDHFKKFNDEYGHIIGDQALSAVASVIRECQRQLEEEGTTVFASRFGGEEFTVICETKDSSGEESLLLAEMIRKRVEAYNFVIRNLDGGIMHTGVKLTISLGVACLNPAWKDSLPLRLLNAADEALYQAKQTGRNRVVAR